VEVQEGFTEHYEAGRRGHRPRGVVVHTTVGTFAAAVAWFGDAASGVSAHYLVGLDGAVMRFVEERDTARHAGRVSNPTAALYDGENPNLYTVGVEFEDGGDPHGVERTEIQYTTGAELLRAIAARWGFPLDRDHVIGHRELTDLKSCPGNLDIARLLRAANG
jgi:N-acetylmuramoyl-L-alanine amidase